MVRRLSGVVLLSSIASVLSLAVPAAAQTKKLGTVGGWAISQMYADDGKFVRCVADSTVVLQPSGKKFSFVLTQSNPNRLWSTNLLNTFTDVLFQSRRMEVIVPE